MNPWLSRALILAIGLPAAWLVGRLIDAYETHAPHDVQRRVYRTIKRLPQLAFRYSLLLMFVFSLGASLLHWLVRPIVGERFLPDTAWAPEMLGGFVLMLLYGFWCAPEAPPAPPPPRGRELKGLPGGSDRFQGRTIRSYRDLE